MTYKVAAKLHSTFTLDGDFNIKLGTTTLDDPMCKGYVYANLYFYDEVQKEVGKLRAMVQKIYNEVTTEGVADPMRLLLEMSTRANRAIGDDGLDAIIKEFLAEKSMHVSLMIDDHEKAKYRQICEAIFMELTAAFYASTLQVATDLDNGVKTFKFAKDYIATLTPNQKIFIAPALRIVALDNQVKLNKLEISQDFTVKYTPEPAQGTFTKQEETIKDQIKTFIQQG
ncbi:MAG: hypothetical protein LBG88_00340 [Christensenellaceae bacterium]|jgi:hypothetical protein|nr:hypothetical protein [Christensenellaceae bacterium]